MKLLLYNRARTYEFLSIQSYESESIIKYSIRSCITPQQTTLIEYRLVFGPSGHLQRAHAPYKEKEVNDVEL